MSDDRELRNLFTRLKHEDRAGVPPFQAPARAARPRVVWLPRVAAVAAVILLAVFLARPNRPPRDLSTVVVDPGSAVWRSPTDFLLVTPGSDLMRTVPAVGSPDPWGPMDFRGRSPAPESTRS